MHHLPKRQSTNNDSSDGWATDRKAWCFNRFRKCYYFCPFTVKIGRRKEKRWCCWFTCLTVRAVHLEIVPKLDTDSCLNAIVRFIARRGKPIMISDNGTIFVEADREFKEYVAAWNKESIEEYLVQQGIRWKLNPPAAPHVGGVWEKLVRSCKKAMYAVLGNRSITEDVLSATMCVVEQTSNARALTPVSSDVNDLESITPNHFVLGNKNICLPYYHGQKSLLIIESSSDKHKRTAISSGTDSEKSICQHWTIEKKWNFESNWILNKGDLDWLVEDSDKRGYHKLGRVTESMEGSDRTIQSATIQTKNGVYKRPVVKLAPQKRSLQEACGETRSNTINGRKCFHEGKQGGRCRSWAR